MLTSMVSLLFGVALAGPPADAWLEAHALPLQEAALSAPLEDLAPLAKRLEGVRVVYLGEATHDDGGATTARLRLLRWLHEEHGIDTLVYESSRVACAEVERALADGRSADEVLSECAHAFWTRTEDAAPLRDYLDRRRSSERPLRVAGMDPQNFAGDGEALAAAIDRELERAGQPPLSSEHRAIAARLATGGYQAMAQERHGHLPGARWVKKVRRYSPPRPVQQAFRAALNERIEGLGSGSARELLRDLSALSAIWSGSMEAYSAARDRRMAETVLALAEEGPVVVWGATIHGAHDLGLLRPPVRQTTAGDHLDRALGEAYYVVATSPLSGSRGGLYGAAERAVPAPDPSSLEAALQRLGRPHALVDLRTEPEGLPEAWITEALGRGREGPWHEALDAVLVFPETHPLRWEPHDAQ